MRLLDEMVEDFQDLVTFIETTPHDDIVKYVAVTRFVRMGALPYQAIHEKPYEKVTILDNNQEIDYEESLKTQTTWVLKKNSGVYASPYDIIKSLEKDLPKYEKAYELMDDDFSRKTMFHIILNRLTGEQRLLEEVLFQEKQYYQPDLIPEKENGVLLDCGGFDGETAIDYINTYGDNYKKIYCFEPDPTQFLVCKENTKNYDNIVYINKGVSDEKSTLKFRSDPLDAGGNRLSSEGNISVDITVIDEEIKEPVTFIKMDIEGIEIPALHGCKKHIQNDRPHLTICLYHLMQDIFAIPLLINRFDNNYRHNMRLHGQIRQVTTTGRTVVLPWELVLYSTPKEEN